MSTLSTFGWAIHDLGLAAGFGGSLFGKLAFEPAARRIQSAEQKKELMQVGWRNFGWINAASLATVAGTWIFGRTMLSGREAGRASRKYVLGKDVLIGVAVVSGVGAMIVGGLLGRRPARTTIPGESDYAYAGKEGKSLQRFVGILGDVNLAAGAGVIAANAILAQKAGRSTLWSAVSRLLP